MSKAPAFQFYAQDFLTGVMYLTNDEIGVYIKMLAKQWTDGKIPKKRLRFLVGLDWDKFSDELKDKFEDRGEYLVNKRLEEERDKQQNRAETSRNNGKKGGRPSKNQNLNKPKANPDESSSYEDEVEEEKEIELEKGGLGEKTDYSKNDFFADWNKLRKEHLKLPSNLNRFNFHETAADFEEISESRSREDFLNAMTGMFKQRKMPHGNESMRIDPKHFLNYFDRYLQAYSENNFSLYGTDDSKSKKDKPKFATNR